MNIGNVNKSEYQLQILSFNAGYGLANKKTC